MKARHYQQLVEIIRFLDRHTIWLANAPEGYTTSGRTMAAYDVKKMDEQLKTLDSVTRKLMDMVNEGIGVLGEMAVSEEEDEQQEQPPEEEALRIVEELNDGMYVDIDPYNDVRPVLIFESTGYDFGIGFCGVCLFDSENDDRVWDEETDEPEPLKPYLVREVLKLFSMLGKMEAKLQEVT
jgi:hypothetical protein